MLCSETLQEDEKISEYSHLSFLLLLNKEMLECNPQYFTYAGNKPEVQVCFLQHLFL